MPENTNPWVPELLRWHGHDVGGVRVPFNEELGNPLRGSADVIVTPLIARLQSLATDLAADSPAPRLVFLVGGPGNGKSEAVQEFVSGLDEKLGCGGALVSGVRKRFRSGMLVPWIVQLGPGDVSQGDFQARVGTLQLVQDASASDTPTGDAARRLVEHLAVLLKSPGDLPLFVCCVNRGVLARCRALAERDPEFNDVATLIKALTDATAITRSSTDAQPVPTWPLDPPLEELAGEVACWAMDTESLLLPTSEGGPAQSPVDRVLEVAVATERWETVGACADCVSRRVCPFRQNSEWLRDQATRKNLLAMLRAGELATAQRWNFRDAFSLVAELVVGERGDFGGFDVHPCSWVHQNARTAGARQTPGLAAAAAFRLVRRLYPQSLFPTSITSQPQGIGRSRTPGGESEITTAIAREEAAAQAPASTHIRSFLGTKLARRLDAALASPRDPSNPLTVLENGYSNSISIGNRGWPLHARRSAAERLFLRFARAAAAEWDQQGRDSARAGDAVRYLQALCCRIAKRSVGVRTGHHGGGAALDEYMAILRDADALDAWTDVISEMLGGSSFGAGAVEIYGQPRGERDERLELIGPRIPITEIVAAPRGEPERPAHDIPFIAVGDSLVPLTFELFTALYLRRAGAPGGSLPASVQASIDRVRHLYAGRLAHEQKAFNQKDAWYQVGTAGRIIARTNESPRFRP